jgi:hypothetical protein
VRPANRIEVLIQLAPASSPVQTIAIYHMKGRISSLVHDWRRLSKLVLQNIPETPMSLFAA